MLVRHLHKLTLLIVACGVSLVLLGCSKRYHNLPTFWAIPISDPVNQSVGRFKTSYIADQIHAYYRGQISGPIAVTTFVDIDNLYQSSTYGRILGEQLMSELAMRGYNVVELRLSDAMHIMNYNGEFSLSRETAMLRNNQEISAMVVGTYAASPLRVYLNARVIEPKTARVMSVGSVEMERTEEITRLLRTNSFPTNLERIPIRSLQSSSVYGSFWPRQQPWFYPNAPTHAPWDDREMKMQMKEQMMVHSEGKTKKVAPELPASTDKK